MAAGSALLLCQGDREDGPVTTGKTLVTNSAFTAWMLGSKLLHTAPEVGQQLEDGHGWAGAV